MRRFVVGLFATIGILVVLAFVGIGGIAWWAVAAHKSNADLPASIILRADLDRGLVAGAGEDSVSSILLGKETPTLRDFLDALDRAGGDARVKGIYVTLGSDNLALATCQEVRDAIHAFRAKGKFAIAFATSFGEFGPGTRPYYLATAFDEIWLQPLGSVGLIGLHTESPFLRSVLDKLGIEPSFEHREQYKTATNFLTETGMTAPEREQIDDLLGSDSGQIVRGIATDRHLSDSAVTALIDRGPLLADEAKTGGLIDRIGYADEARVRAAQRGGAGAKFVALSRYLDDAGRPHRSGPKIAVIYGTGLITQGGGGPESPLSSDRGITAARLARAFRDAAGDKDVKAILFRVDSPGGSAVASETIWREVARAKERGKPVVVSMGDVAGSGGYYIAAPADKIVAEPATLTGSIGVLAGKIVIAGLLNKLGINADAAERGANAAMFSEFEDFSPLAKARLDAFLDETYAGFKQRVASGRHLTPDQVEAVAKGRVWTGEEAAKNGLVDALGGYETALQLTLQAAKVPADKPFRVAVFPRHKSLLERLVDRIRDRNGDGDDDGLGAVSDDGGGDAGDLMRLVADARNILGNPGMLHMPFLGDIR